MTPEVAVTKWCPLQWTTRNDEVVQPDNPHRDPNAPHTEHCKAGGCMFWRMKNPAHADSGYCGLGGHPADAP